MQSLRELYRIGIGPSSSHTMGPQKAAAKFIEAYPDADAYRVVLYGSLAMTGKGHLTDIAIKEAFAPRAVEIVFDTETQNLPHPNTLDLSAVADGKTVLWRAISPGGGLIKIEGQRQTDPVNVYPHRSFGDIAKYCTEKEIRLCDYVREFEGDEIFEFLGEVWRAMNRSISEGLKNSGMLDGGLRVMRKAKWLFNSRHIDESPEVKENRIVCAFAFAVSEQNAGGGRIVTAPTCGACGVLPAVLRYTQQKRKFTDEDILNALATGGVIGNLIKTNASISGAECGCQAEIGSACAMAAAALGELYGMEVDQIEYAAEISLEHHLGLTCDPIGGLVQIPCIERNAVAAMRAINAVSLANFLTGTRLISFDHVVETMYETGKDLKSDYRETSVSGLAKLYKGMLKE